MKFGYQLTQSQKQTMSQNQIESLRILTLPVPELRDFLKQEFLENPMLEYTPSGRSGAAETITYRQEMTEASDNWRTAEIPAPVIFGVREAVRDQIPTGFTSEERDVVEYLIDELDEKGFCTADPEAVSRDLKTLYGEAEAYRKERVEEILQVLRHMEPAGIFSEDLKACLERQMMVRGMGDSAAFQIVHGYLPELFAGKISAISRGLHISTLEVRKAVEQIAELNPCPARGLSGTPAEYHEPDILLSHTGDGGWRAAINDDWTEDYSICDHYLRMMKSAEDEELQAYFEKNLMRARLVIAGIRQRRETLETVCEAIAEVQTEYLCGTGPLRPLTMGQIAEKLGIHTSTVSRALKEKWLQYPGGMIPAKTLFSVGLPSGGAAGNASSDDVKERIRRLIAAEDRTRPLSDAAIASALSGDGVKISRRAVAKYRGELGIPGSFERRDP